VNEAQSVDCNVFDFKSKYDSLFERQKALLDEMALARNHLGSIHQKTSAIVQKKKINKYPDTLARLIRQQSESDRKSVTHNNNSLSEN